MIEKIIKKIKNNKIIKEKNYLRKKIYSHKKQNPGPAQDLTDLSPPNSTPYKAGIPKDSLST